MERATGISSSTPTTVVTPRKIPRAQWPPRMGSFEAELTSVPEGANLGLCGNPQAISYAAGRSWRRAKRGRPEDFSRSPAGGAHGLVIGVDTAREMAKKARDTPREPGPRTSSSASAKSSASRSPTSSSRIGTDREFIGTSLHLLSSTRNWLSRYPLSTLELPTTTRL